MYIKLIMELKKVYNNSKQPCYFYNRLEDNLETLINEKDADFDSVLDDYNLACKAYLGADFLHLFISVCTTLFSFLAVVISLLGVVGELTYAENLDCSSIIIFISFLILIVVFTAGSIYYHNKKSIVLEIQQILMRIKEKREECCK